MENRNSVNNSGIGILCSKNSNGRLAFPAVAGLLVYIYLHDGLLHRFSGSGVGCYIGHVFSGALAYADYVVLLAPTPSAMRRPYSIKNLRRVC